MSALPTSVQAASDPHFVPLASPVSTVQDELRSVFIPQNRLTPLRENWEKIYDPIVNFMKLDVRFNLQTKRIEFRTNHTTENPAAIQKTEEFLKAFALGFDVDDAVVLLRLDNLYLETFNIRDIKLLPGDDEARAIGRMAGQGGKVKFAIENATHTRIVIANYNVHVLGSWQNVKLAINALQDLVIGSPPGKVYSRLQIIANRSKI